MAFIGFHSLNFGDLFHSDSSTRGIGPAISLPFFDGARLRGKLAASTAAYDAAVESYNETVLHALENVASTLASAQSAQRQKHLIDAGVSAAEKARDLASKGHAAGLTDFLVVLNSEMALIQQEDMRAQIISRQLQSYADLMIALGGGLQKQSMPKENP
jgi:outer membrane protein TolC